MNEPLVCCVMLTRDRPELAARAIRCFEAQTYKRKRLLIWDTSVETHEHGGPRIIHEFPQMRGATIGELRNVANRYASTHYVAAADRPDLFAHWDDDDWSHPMRLAEQVALIEGDPKLDAVGYSDMLFSVRRCAECGDPACAHQGIKIEDAWLYTSTSDYLLGTSLMYRRAAWERKRFEHVSQGEDKRWLKGMRTLGHTSLFRWSGPSGSGHDDLQPRMIASIHGANTSSRIDPTSENWKRVPEWDAHCRATLSPAPPDHAPPAPLATQPTGRS